MSRSVYFIVLIGAVFNVDAQNKNDSCGIQTSENQYPWLIAIEYIYSNESTPIIGCTGALISTRHAITKVECMDELHKEATSVLLGLYNTGAGCTGSDNCTEEGPLRVPIERFLRHPKYYKIGSRTYKTAQYDIALVRFQKMVSFTDHIRPICLPSGDITKLDTTNLELYVTGLDNQNPASKLHTATTYLDENKCLRLRFDRVVPQDLFCANDKEALECLMMGSILVNKRRDTYELTGLLDVGSSCGLTKRFANIFLFRDWIKGEIPEWTPCGRRKVEHIALITNGEFTKEGDWPWHVAIFRLQKSKNHYICGGTLVSKAMVLTAAHCVTIRGGPVDPDILTVFLGKYYLSGEDLEAQEKKVQTVIVNEDFTPNNYLNNDIALLKLSTEASYTDFVQPACIWSDEASNRLPSNSHFGMVVGWGFDESDMLSSRLKQAKIPKVSDGTCIRRNPGFYSNVLSNNKKFCAGFANGTSPCNGDSGGGFLMFVPISAQSDSANPVGTWYIRGIVSTTPAVKNLARCDPNQYVVFTDVAKYIDWIQKHLE